MRVVLDTNIIISALLFRGKAGAMVPLWQSQQIKLLASGDMIREYARVLSYPKFHLEEKEIRELLNEEILPFVTPITVTHTPAVIAKDPSDDKFLACAVMGRAEWIVSGDRHLLDLKSHHKIPIVDLAVFLSHIISSHE
jgi:putative PIN family toxin of toxin-antitoxin system